MKPSVSFCKKHNKVHVIGKAEERYFYIDRAVVRPSINWFAVVWKTALALLITFAAVEGIYLLLMENTGLGYPVSVYVHVGLYIAILLIICLVRSKSIMIFIIHVYQKYAPYPMRASCLFIPNCSEYMILAIRKYGTFRGIKMGLARFRRCEAPNGGVDYP